MKVASGSASCQEQGNVLVTGGAAAAGRPARDGGGGRRVLARCLASAATYGASHDAIDALEAQLQFTKGRYGYLL